MGVALAARGRRGLSPWAAKVRAKHAAYGILARCVPERGWPCVALMLGSFATALRPDRARGTAERLARFLGDSRPQTALQHAERERAAERLLSALVVQKLHRQSQYRPDVALLGQEHIEAALDQGQGAILWSAQFHAANVIEPLALHRAGVALHHLSRRGLGMTDAAVNAMWTDMVVAVEDRFLAERIVIEDNAAAAVLTLRQRLKNNLVIVIRALDFGDRVFEMPFFDGRIRIAPGALELALATNAKVLPVFTIRTGICSFQVHVEAPLHIGGDRGRKAAIAAAMIDYVGRLEAHVLANPSQWNGWTNQASPAGSESEVGIRVVPGRLPPQSKIGSD